MGRSAGRIQEVWEVCQAEELIVWNEKGSVQMAGWPRKGTGEDGFGIWS